MLGFYTSLQSHAVGARSESEEEHWGLTQKSGGTVGSDLPPSVLPAGCGATPFCTAVPGVHEAQFTISLLVGI